MDQEQFDQITRTLASGLSRRGVLRMLSAVGAGGVLAVVGRGTTEAGKPVKCPRANQCGKGKQAQCCTCKQTCTGGTCVATSKTVSIRLVDYDGSGDYCYVWVDVTGFAEGDYIANVVAPPAYPGPFPTSVIVGSGGTGSGSDGSLFGSGNISVEATMEGVCSDPIPLIC
jgi:hypothetical protein